MELTKLIGWIIFLLGISIIFFVLYFSYNIFTGREEVPEIFVFEEEKEVQTEENQELPPGGIQGQLEEMIGKQLKDVFPSFDIFSGDTFSKLLNLVVWSIGAGVLIFGGSQVAGLGIKLIKSSPQPRESQRT
jgi:hypothetical protein